jgi:hypothetical protein
VRFRTTVFLAGALALLSLAYYFLELREAEKEAKTKLASFTQDEATAFSIRRGDTVITVRKGEGQWRMTQPVEDRGDEKEITSLLGNITRAKIERTLDVKEETLGDFGLQAPAIVLTVYLKEQEKPFTLEVGSTTPAGFSVYARRPGERKVFVAPSTVKTSLEKKPFAFRSKVPLFFDQDKVRAVSLRADSLRVRLERQEEKEWQITSPIEVRADSGKVADLIRFLTEEHIEAFLDEPPANLNLKKRGLKPPRGEIRLTLEGGAAATLFLGSKKKGGAVYARRHGDEGVLELKEDFWKALPKKAADLRDRTLLALDLEKVEQFELKSPKGQMVLKKVDGRWRIAQPEEGPADQRLVEDLLWDLDGARVKEFVADHAKSLKPYGLDVPPVTIRLLDQAGNALTSLTLNSAVKKGGAYARVGDAYAVYLVEPDLYEQLNKGPFDLRFRRLLRFETWDVGKLALSRDGQEILLEKREEEWELTKPRQGKAKYSAVIDLLNDIKNLKWEKLVTKASTDLPRYGLDKPVAAFTLTKTDGESLGTVLLGKTEGNLVYAKLQEKSEIYEIHSTFLQSLPQEPAALAE